MQSPFQFQVATRPVRCPHESWKYSAALALLLTTVLFTVYNVIAGSSFSGPKLNGTFTGVAEVSQTTTEVGDFYQSIDVTVWGHTAQGVPFYAVEGGRGNPTKNQLRRIQIDIGPGHAELLEGLYVGDLLAPPSDRLSIITYEIKDPKITFP